MSLSRAQLFATPWTVVYQVPPTMGFSRQEYRSGYHFLLQEIFPSHGLNPGLPHCRQTLYSLSHQGSPKRKTVQQNRKYKHYWMKRHSVQFSSVQFSHSVVPNSLRPHESQQVRLPCSSPSPGVHSDSCLSSPWCHPTIHAFSCHPLLLRSLTHTKMWLVGMR